SRVQVRRGALPLTAPHPCSAPLYLSPSASQAEGLLEARPEAGFPLQRHVFALTGLAPRHVGVAVGQPRQVSEPRAQVGDVPRQTDVKVGIEGPLPVRPKFVVLALAQA